MTNRDKSQPADRQTRRLLRRRNKRAVVPLYENSALRDNLTDEQAESVLAWGAAQIAAMVQFTTQLPDEDATAVIESRATAVRRALHWLNMAVAETVNTADIDLGQLWDALGHVVALPADVPDSVQAWWQALQAQTADQRFQQLQTLFQHPEQWVELTASSTSTPPASHVHADENRPQAL